MEKVSVIIPVYNTGHYLRDCIASICGQTHSNLQIIIIDDGSNDETAKICNEIAKCDERITLVHKSNEGVSIARNTGLKLADGEIVCFIDSDDTIDSKMIESLVEALNSNDAQISMCDAVTICPGHSNEPDTIPDYNQSCVIERNDISPDTLTRLAGSAWRCAFRRVDILLASQAQFPEGIKFSEDRIFNIVAMSKANKIAYIKTPFYNRLIRKGSACSRYYADMTSQICKVRDVLVPAVRNLWGEKYVPAYERQIAEKIRAAVTNFTQFSNGESMSSSITKIKELCCSEQVRKCIKVAECEDIRCRMILKRQYVGLFVIGKLTNLYHKICRRGEYQR